MSWRIIELLIIFTSVDCARKMASTRRLTAILAADVAGYSGLMGIDEEGTHERLGAHRRLLIDPKIKEHQGRIVKTTGDGLLVEFASVVDAVRCATEVQRGMIDRDADLTAERRIRFRIGVNLGDIIAEGDDIFGDGVNVAARLEALASQVGSVFREPCATKSATRSHTSSRISASRASRISPVRCGSTDWLPQRLRVCRQRACRRLWQARSLQLLPDYPLW
jgi:class 3 adenylate cyclase